MHYQEPNLRILGTIRHNDGDEHGRVTLYAGENGNVWAAALDEALYDTETPISQLTTAWQGPAWDFQPAAEFVEGQIVWAASGERLGNPVHCQLLDAYRTSRAEAIADAKEWLHQANDTNCDAYVRPWIIDDVDEDGTIMQATTNGPADWNGALTPFGEMIIRDDNPTA